MPTLQEWRAYYETWAGQSPLLASTGTEVQEVIFEEVGGVLADWLQLDGTETVLDVGCGSGTLTSHWASRAGRVTGFDFCLPLLREGIERHGPAGMRFVNGEAAGLPFSEHSFDRVCCFGVLLSLPDHAHVDRAIGEILRVARPGARVVLGGLPDARRKNRFFDLLDARGGWIRRVVPRAMRWSAKRLLLPGSTPGKTRILWFDIDALAASLRRAGWRVQVEPDPAFASYQDYRCSLILSGNRRRTG